MEKYARSIRGSRSGRRWSMARLEAYRRNLGKPWVRRRGPARGWSGPDEVNQAQGEEGIGPLTGLGGGFEAGYETAEDQFMKREQGAAFAWWAGLGPAEREVVIARCRTK